MRQIVVSGIQWEADDEEDIQDLPTEMLLNVPDDVADEDIEEFIENELSNQSGFTHTGWEEYVLV